MARLTQAQRARIGALFTQHRDRPGPEDHDETTWRSICHVAAEVKQSPQTVRYALIAIGVIDPPRPVLTDLEIEAIAATYAQVRSIRHTAKLHQSSFGTVRNVLVHKGVLLPSSSGGTRRGRGAPR
jgi:hypothetical protein